MEAPELMKMRLAKNQLPYTTVVKQNHACIPEETSLPHRTVVTQNHDCIPEKTSHETNAGQVIQMDNCKDAALHFEQKLQDATDVLPHNTREVIPRTATTTRAFLPAYAADNGAPDARAPPYEEHIMEEDKANGLCPALLCPPSYNKPRDTLIGCWAVTSLPKVKLLPSHNIVFVQTYHAQPHGATYGWS